MYLLLPFMWVAASERAWPYSCYLMGPCKFDELCNGYQGFFFETVANPTQMQSIGDLNGDGIDDFSVVLANTSWYVIFGSQESGHWGIFGDAKLSDFADGKKGFQMTGDSFAVVRSAGDLNGDGIGDVLFGAPYQTPGSPGVAYVVFGTKDPSAWGSGQLNIKSLVDGRKGFVLSGEPDDGAGSSADMAGDINGDGIADLVLGAPYANALYGKTYVVFGTIDSSRWSQGNVSLTALLDGSRGFVLNGEIPNDVSGMSVSRGGDLNGDHVDDLLTTGGGTTYVIFGSKNTTNWGKGYLLLERFIDGTRGAALRGVNTRSVGSGDFNGDGFSDILFAGGPQKNAAYVWFGEPEWLSDANFSVAPYLNGRAGFSLNPEYDGGLTLASGVSGDYNGDGITDILVSSPTLRGQTGRSYVVYGSRNTKAWGTGYVRLQDFMDGQNGFDLSSVIGEDYSGNSLSSADVNGDGYTDILVGGKKSYVVFGFKKT